MRPPLLALGAAGALAIVVSACGGGGSHATPVPPAQSAVTDPNPNMTVNSGNGPMGTMTITLKLPKTTPASAAVRAQIKKFGPKHANARIRQLANTSPSATIRAMGQQRNAYAKKVQESGARTPLFIDGSTNELELVVSDSFNDTTDTTQGCSLSAGQCTATFNVPVGSNLTVSLLTYDDCDYLLAAGSLSGLNITAGVNPQQTITLNGVVAYFGVTASAAPFVADVAGSQAQPSFTVSAQPVDADNNVIQAPGTLIDESFNPIQSLNVTALAIDNPSFVEQFPTTVPSSNVSPGFQSVSVTGAAVADATFAYSGTGTDVNEVFQISENTAGSPVLPGVFIYGPYGCCSVPPAGPNANNPPIGQSGNYSVTPALAWSYQSGANNNPTFTGPTSFALWIAEFPTVTPQAGVNFIALSNLPGFLGLISLSDDAEAGCSAFTPTPSESAGPIPYTTESTTGYSFDFATANTTCQFVASDNFGNTANLEMAVDSTNITVQRKARKH